MVREKVVYQDQQAELGSSVEQAAAGKAAQCAVLFDVGEAKLHGLLAFLVELFGFVGRHPRTMRFDQRFVFAPLHAAASLWVFRAAYVQRAAATMFG